MANNGLPFCPNTCWNRYGLITGSINQKYIFLKAKHPASPCTSGASSICTVVHCQNWPWRQRLFCPYPSSQLRYPFADAGVNLHAIKELLGHSNLDTTLVYLHLQQNVRAAIISPFDHLLTITVSQNETAATPIPQSVAPTKPNPKKIQQQKRKKSPPNLLWITIQAKPDASRINTGATSAVCR